MTKKNKKLKKNKKQKNDEKMTKQPDKFEVEESAVLSR